MYSIRTNERIHAQPTNIAQIGVSTSPRFLVLAGNIRDGDGGGDDEEEKASNSRYRSFVVSVLGTAFVRNSQRQLGHWCLSIAY